MTHIYRVVWIDHQEFEREMNEYAGQGWEFVTILTTSETEREIYAHKVLIKKVRDL